MARCIGPLVASVLVVIVATPARAGDPRYPYPQNVAYLSGSLVPSQRPLDQLNEEVAAAYWRWKGSYLVQAGTEADGHPRYRVRMGTSTNDPTVSEGQGYGMLIAALMAGEDDDAQTLFDGLWEYRADHPSENDPRLMDWHVPSDEALEPGEDGSAFDGDCDIAYALLLAEQQWGNDGRVSYRARAVQVLAGLLDSTVGPDSHLPLLGDWVEPEGATYNQWTTRTSDFMVGHFRAFYRLTGHPEWNAVVSTLQDLVDSLQFGFSPTTGLLPDFIVPVSPDDPTLQPAPPDFLEGPHDGDYFYNAGRDPWRLAVDALLSGDTASRTQVRRMTSWVRFATGGDPAAVQAGYRLDGTPIDGHFTTFFAAPFGVAMMLDPSGQGWLNAVYDRVRQEEEGYYEDTVTLLCLLAMTRNWWDPSQPPPTCDPPAVPGSVAASTGTAPSGEAYTISWAAAALADSYEVREATEPGFTDPESFTTAGLQRSFEHAVAADTTFHYRVRALRDCGASSDWSDAVAVTVTAPPACTGYRFLVAGVASRPGLGGTRWRTTLSVANPGPDAVTVDLVYRYTVGSTTATATVPGYGIVGWDDVVGTLFGVAGISGGAVEVCSPVQVVVQARTYNDASSGTFGQYLPGVGEREALAHGDVGLLGQLRKSDDFRTNVGFVNLDDAACGVRVTLRSSDGDLLGIVLERTVPAGEWLQLNDVFDLATVSAADLATATVEVTTAGGRVWAYASVVDTGSGDATTIPVVILAN